MIDLFNIEKQTARRMDNYLSHLATRDSIVKENSRLVISIKNQFLQVSLYEHQQFIKNIPIDSIADFFGFTYEENKQKALEKYILSLAERHTIPIENTLLVICYHKGQVGAFLYNFSQYIRRLEMMEVIAYFYSLR